SRIDYSGINHYAPGAKPEISAPFDARDTSKRTIGFADDTGDPKAYGALRRTATHFTQVGSFIVHPQRRGTRKPKLLLLREERDRFNAMRKIQSNTSRFKNWYALCLSVIAFGVLWCVGAAVFWQAEKDIQGMTYFQGLYFCYVSLLTIGYGDLGPKSNAGRPFFVFWSLIAVPTMTILVSDLGESVIGKFKRGTSGLADFTVLPQKGIWRNVLIKYPWLLSWMQARKQKKETRRRLEEGFPYGPGEPEVHQPTIEDLAEEPTDPELAGKLSRAIKRVAGDIRNAHHSERRQYSYKEWVEFTQLIRFTAKLDKEREEEEEEEEAEEGMVEWDWIGEDSPMMAKQSEAEFVLDRLLESLARYVKRKEKAATNAVAPESGAKVEIEETVNATAGMRSRRAWVEQRHRCLALCVRLASFTT
ncbi:hypothetical protein AC579_10372, partial [Pseudocercospora musae]